MTMTGNALKGNARHRSGQQIAAAASAALGAALLAVKAVRTFGPDTYGTLEPAAGIVVAVVAMTALGVAAAVFVAPRAAGPLSLLALAGALAVDWLPAAPPRLIALLPLSLAAGLLFVGARAGSARPLPRRRVESLSVEGPASVEGQGVGDRPTRHPIWAQGLGWAGLLLHVAAGFPYLVSGLVAPLYGVLFLWALWGALLVVALRLRVQRPAWTPLVPVAALALLQAVMILGGAAFDWQA